MIWIIYEKISGHRSESKKAKHGKLANAFSYHLQKNRLFLPSKEGVANWSSNFWNSKKLPGMAIGSVLARSLLTLAGRLKTPKKILALKF